MFALYAKNEEPYVYQDTIFLGIFSDIEIAKEQMYLYNSNIKSEKVTYKPDYKYFIFQTNIDKKVIIEEHEAILSFYNDKIINHRIVQFDLSNITCKNKIDVSTQTEEPIEHSINILNFFMKIDYDKIIYTTLFFSAIYVLHNK